MKNYFLTATTALAILFSSCGAQQQKKVDEKKSDTKSLVLYFSQTGATKSVAEEIQKELGADIEALELDSPYVGTYEETLKRVGQERESGILPKIITLKSDLNKYDTIYLGYPIWFGTYALPITSLVKDHDFANKYIIPFCTFGSGGLEPSMEDLKKALPMAKIADNGFGIRNARLNATAKELNRFLIENGYLEGTIEKLDDYSELKKVNEEDKAIFDAACSSYKYPMGKPVLVGKRNTKDATDYIFKVENNGGTSTIYITVLNEKDSKPEFTKVVR